MTSDQLFALVIQQIGPPLVAVAAAVAGLALTGLTKRAGAWLDAHGHAQASAVVADASTRVQSAMQNAAGQIALEVQNGDLKLSDATALRDRLAALASGIFKKLPDATATLGAAQESVIEGIRGKITAALPVPDPAGMSLGFAALSQPAPANANQQPDRRSFFAAVRSTVFGGRIVQSQVDGCERILDFWNDALIENDVRFLAYMLATTFWETAHTMQPVEEFGKGRGRFYGSTPFYGRGLVQLTLEANYRKMSPVAGCNLVASPARALEWPIALKIMSFGMTTGAFTGRKLADYFGAATDDPVGARAIINGKDRADEIAAIYRSFLAALQAEAQRELAA